MVESLSGTEWVVLFAYHNLIRDSPTIRSARSDHKLLAQCVRAWREERRRHITCFLADLCSYWRQITFTSLAV